MTGAEREPDAVVERALAEVLAEHVWDVSANGGLACACGWRPTTRRPASDLNAHVASVLAAGPVGDALRQARAEDTARAAAAEARVAELEATVARVEALANSWQQAGLHAAGDIRAALSLAQGETGVNRG